MSLTASHTVTTSGRAARATRQLSASASPDRRAGDADVDVRVPPSARVVQHPRPGLASSGGPRRPRRSRSRPRPHRWGRRPGSGRGPPPRELPAGRTGFLPDGPGRLAASRCGVLPASAQGERRGDRYGGEEGAAERSELHPSTVGRSGSSVPIGPPVRRARLASGGRRPPLGGRAVHLTARRDRVVRSGPEGQRPSTDN